MTGLGFFASLVLLVLKLAAIGTFAAVSWWIVALPLLIGVGIDILVFIIFGATIFGLSKRL